MIVDTHSYSSTATGTASVISTRPGESDLGMKASTVTFGARPSNVVFYLGFLGMHGCDDDDDLLRNDPRQTRWDASSYWS